MSFLSRYGSYHIDAIILDIDLPGEDGLEIARKLAKECSHIPIVVFSNLDHPRYNSIFYSLGIKKCIVKSQFTTLEAEILDLFQLGHLKSTSRNELAAEENRLLSLICDDIPIENIAEKLMIGVDAAKKRKSKLAYKLQIKNKDMHFLKWGIKHGYYYV